MDDWEYMDFVRETALRIKERITTELMTKPNLTREEIQKEVDSIKTETRKLVRQEMFGWGEFRLGNPAEWEKLKANRAVQIPLTVPEKDKLSSTLKWKGEDGKEIFATRDEVMEYNRVSMKNYIEMVNEYLLENPDKTDRNEVTNEFVYNEVLKNLWTSAREIAKGEFIENRSNKK